MLARTMWVLGVSAATLGGLQACGSDSGGAHPGPDASHGGKAGTGATGGKAGAGGASGAGGTGMLGCDTSACDQQLAPLQSALGGVVTLKSCCLSATKCGIDTSGLGALLGGAAGGCLDPNAVVPGDAGPPPGPTITILDGGIIPVGDGGFPIQLDKSCPDISSQGVTAQGAPVSLDLPGCCRPEGFCGGSTHTLVGAGTTVPLLCESYDDVATAANDAFGNALTIPDDPRIQCKYTAARVGGPPDASADSAPPRKPDAAPTPKPDAAPTSHPDAAPTSHPDAVPPSKPDAGDAATAPGP